nr:immunoglobulin heavy chain junction region [Macaca mulatta]MOX15175.1 immunoglobulin heavy chain junction region [Macaca mulatta]MOX15857.1 immunoglobulin heavy chain junction region [Macaca mulatta]MOX16068.1 immunoglobulin heavy chain junction region [Macaca mulatta]
CTRIKIGDPPSHEWFDVW